MAVENILLARMIQNGLDVWIQDQATSPFQYYLMREDKTDITLTSPIAVDDEIINVSAGHGFTVIPETYVVVYENNNYFQSKVKAVSTNAITIDTPSSTAYTTGSAVIRGVTDMSVDADPTSQDFCFIPRKSTVPIDVQYAVLTMICAAEPDDSKFGNLAALAGGMFFRRENGTITNYGNYKKNQDFAEFGAQVEYSDKAGGGAYSVNVVFEIKKVFGIVLRMDPSLPDIFLARIRDDISGLTSMKVALMGQYTLGEE